MLLMDGVRYEEWTPPDEAVLAGMVKEHARDIFGEHTLYFGNLKKRIKTQAGVGSIPDGWAIILGVPMQAYPVEIEHSSHDVYGHISPQIDKMQAALKNPDAQRQIISAIYEEITQDGLVNAKAKAKVGSHDLHKLLSDSISNPQLQLVIVIDTASAQLQECAANKAVQPKIVGFHTFQRVGAEVVHIHQFEPLFAVTPLTATPTPTRTSIPGPSPRTTLPGSITRIIATPSEVKYALIRFDQSQRSFFPGYEVRFDLETDIGVLQAYVTSAPKATPMGDPTAGSYIKAGRGPKAKRLLSWFRQHPDLKVGSELRIEELQPKSRYKLTIVKA